MVLFSCWFRAKSWDNYLQRLILIDKWRNRSRVCDLGRLYQAFYISLSIGHRMIWRGKKVKLREYNLSSSLKWKCWINDSKIVSISSLKTLWGYDKVNDKLPFTSHMEYFRLTLTLNLVLFNSRENCTGARALEFFFF